MRARASLLAGALLAAAIIIYQCLDPLTSDGWLAVWAGGIVNDVGIPQGDGWTTGDVHPWVDQQWLGQWIIYLLYAGMGTAGVSIIGVILPAGIALLLAARSALVRGAPGWAVGAALPIGALALAPFLVVRPQTLVLPLFVAMLAILVNGRRRPWRLWLLLPILLIWANLHGSVLLAAAISLLGVIWALAPLWRVSARGDRLLFGVLAGGIAISPLLSPLWMQLPGYWARLLDPNGAPALAMEWLPLDASEDRILGLMVIGAGILLLARRHLALPERLLLIGLALATLWSVRNGLWLTLALLLAAPVAAQDIRAINPGQLPRIARGVIRRMRDGSVALALLVICGALLAAALISAPRADLERNAAPASALVTTAGPILADIHAANWLLQEYPQLAGRIAFDARLEIYPRGAVRAAVDTLSGYDTDPSTLQRYTWIAIDSDQRDERLRRLGDRIEIIASSEDLTVARVRR